ncbi:hypothetical protein ACI6Q2_10315 [Chitinophagaceae bacterium LWZ2-11]
MIRFILIVILGIVSIASTSCKTGKRNLNITKNDTTEIFKILIDSAFYRQRIPDYSALKHNNPFGDSIIIRFDSIFIRHLPTDQKFKILTQDQICSLATQCDNDSIHFCNFLEITSFKKIDTAYEISLQNQCVMPLYDKSGKPRYPKDFYKNISHFNCMFGMLCGGGIGMIFTKHADTLKGRIAGCWSD